MPSKRPTTRQAHGPKVERSPDTRASAASRGYGRKHRKWRQMVLHRYPICNICQREPATIADHVVPWQDGGDKFTLENGQGLCATCHNRKTALDVRARHA